MNHHFLIPCKKSSCKISTIISILLIYGCVITSDMPPPAHTLEISNQYFEGTLHDNISNKKRQGAGFTPLIHTLFPAQNLYRNDAVGLNFEHIMNGTAQDAEISMFTPRRDSCLIKQISDSAAAVIHPAEYSSWNIDSKMTYTLKGKYYIDLEFSATLRQNKFPLDYIGFMWASYMNCALDRRIYFPGNEQGAVSWTAFGEDIGDGFETGTVAYSATTPLNYEENAKTLNIIEHPHKKFHYPFYFGLVHGSGNTETENDTMVYIMMFNQSESIRFAMWNFFRNPENQPDTHSPAWDWQYVIHHPVLDKEYGYRARIVYKPFAGRRDVIEEYRKWSGRLIDKFH